ncbi:MAG: hypothetical protein IPK13_12740 [Deltaproteobacteria bacterium]|nr:hypothetical protein [Deltaproteobacteria bacterium]
MRTPGVAAAFVYAAGCQSGASPPALTARVARAVSLAATAPDRSEVFDRVRGVLRFGKYKPTGRGKPASEYLAKAALENRFPQINNLVDVNNLVSLESGLPISMVDVGRAETDSFCLRRGLPGEAYVFNTSGQSIDLEDLLLLACLPSDRPCANPVKDSMSTKVAPTTDRVLAVVYASPVDLPRLEDAARSLDEGLRSFGQATEVVHAVWTM